MVLWQQTYSDTSGLKRPITSLSFQLLGAYQDVRTEMADEET